MVAFDDELTTLTGFHQTRDYIRWLVDEAFGPLFADAPAGSPT